MWTKSWTKISQKENGVCLCGKIKSDKLCFKYASYAAVINELGYPSLGALRHWVEEYKGHGDVTKILLDNPNIRIKKSVKQLMVRMDRPNGPSSSHTFDVTEFKHGNHLKAYLSAILDYGANQIVAFKLSDRNDNALVHDTIIQIEDF